MLISIQYAKIFTIFILNINEHEIKKEQIYIYIIIIKFCSNVVHC